MTLLVFLLVCTHCSFALVAVGMLSKQDTQTKFLQNSHCFLQKSGFCRFEAVILQWLLHTLIAARSLESQIRDSTSLATSHCSSLRTLIVNVSRNDCSHLETSICSVRRHTIYCVHPFKCTQRVATALRLSPTSSNTVQDPSWAFILAGMHKAFAKADWNQYCRKDEQTACNRASLAERNWNKNNQARMIITESQTRLVFPPAFNQEKSKHLRPLSQPSSQLSCWHTATATKTSLSSSILSSTYYQVATKC